MLYQCLFHSLVFVTLLASILIYVYIFTKFDCDMVYEYVIIKLLIIIASKATINA